jgi:aldehyde dehydrogenase (NAD+)
MFIDCQNLIGGQFVDAANGAKFENICPADTRHVIGTIPDSGAKDIDAAVASAKKAFESWRQVPAPSRGDLLYAVAAKIRERAEDLAQALSWEEGKIIGESRGEVQKTLKYLEFAAGDGRRMNGITSPSEIPGTFAMTIWRPRGVIGLITPWNFPVAIPMWKIAPAIVAGNTVVLKPAPETPATAHILGEILREAGIPDGVVNIVHGDVEPAQALLHHPDVEAISFTGSTQVGRIIEKACGENHKSVQCELGGKNAIIVLGDGDVALAAGATAVGAFGSTGQRCTATSRAIVMESVADEFVETVTAKAHEIVAGHPMTDGVSMGPSVSERQMAQVLRYMDIGRGEASLRAGGGRLDHGDLAHGYFPAPTVFDNVPRGSRIAVEEIFGPVLSVVRVSSFDDAIDVANEIPFGLTSSIYTRDIGRIFDAIERIDAGMTQINNPTIGGEGHLPFGGTKATGVGPREMGPDAWKFYAEEKTVYINHGGGARRGKFY